MGLAELHNDGQITVPIEIRRILKLKDGDKISFVQKDNGDIVIDKPATNPTWAAFQEAQKAFEGCEWSEEEILEDIMRARYGENA